MKRVFLEHMGLIAVGMVCMGMVIGCSTTPVSEQVAAAGTPEECRAVFEKVASDSPASAVSTPATNNTSTGVVKKSRRRQGK